MNTTEMIVIASKANNIPVKAGEKVASMRVVPLVIERSRLSGVQEDINDPVFNVLPYRSLKAAIFVTGGEILHQRIKDTFSHVVLENW